MHQNSIINISWSSLHYDSEAVLWLQQARMTSTLIIPLWGGLIVTHTPYKPLIMWVIISAFMGSHQSISYNMQEVMVEIYPLVLLVFIQTDYANAWIERQKWFKIQKLMPFYLCGWLKLNGTSVIYIPFNWLNFCFLILQNKEKWMLGILASVTSAFIVSHRITKIMIMCIYL